MKFKFWSYRSPLIQETYIQDVPDAIKMFPEPCILGIDQSTTCSGLVFLGINSNKLLCVLEARRSSGEGANEYSDAFRAFLRELLNYGCVGEMGFEKSINRGFHKTNHAIAQIVGAIQRVDAEYRAKHPEFPFIPPIDNTIWKSEIFPEVKLQGNQAEKKEQMYDYVRAKFPLFDNFTNNATDAFGIALYMRKMRHNKANNIVDRNALEYGADFYVKGFPTKEVALEFIGARNFSECMLQSSLGLELNLRKSFSFGDITLAELTDTSHLIEAICISRQILHENYFIVSSKYDLEVQV